MDAGRGAGSGRIREPSFRVATRFATLLAGSVARTNARAELIWSSTREAYGNRSGTVRSRARILIVDKEPNMVAILRPYLVVGGWTVDTALNAG